MLVLDKRKNNNSNRIRSKLVIYVVGLKDDVIVVSMSLMKLFENELVSL